MQRILLVGVLVLMVTTGFSQDFQFSQYYQAPLYLNPGFTGITQQQRVAFNHRVQWPNLPQAFATYAASYDIFVDELRSGFGLQITNDRMGSAGWQTTNVNVLYSFKVKLTEKLVFSPGLVFGYGTNGIDRSKLQFGDGFDPEEQRLGRQSFFDVGAGFLLYSRSIWLGASFHHLNKPNISMMGTEDRLPMRLTIHGGMRLNLSGGGLRPRGARMSYLTPSFIYRTQGPAFSQLDIGMNYHIDPVSIGVFYRGKPYQKNPAESPALQQDAVILALGMYFKKIMIGYSYDFTISDFGTASGGAHEISIIYEFSSKPAGRSLKKKYKLIPCPTFNSKEGFWN
jgi:type IX secretion system PorP/SprF family membrane protein